MPAEPIRTLFREKLESCEPLLPEGLRVQYDGDLRFPAAPDARPYLVANFVSTIDGVVSFNVPGLAGGGAISGANEGDRFIMGLLRASADAVLVASGTVNAVAHEHLWLPESIYPARSDLYRYYRTALLHKPEHPLIVIVSGTGRLDLNRAVFQTPGIRVVVITTDEGFSRLHMERANTLELTEVTPLPASHGRIAPDAILMLLKNEFGVGLVLTEGGPTLFGEFVTRGLVDELFLTIAPQIAGRVNQHPRPALVEGAEFTPATAPWLKVLSAKIAGDHLYLRYRKTTDVAVR